VRTAVAAALPRRPALSPRAKRRVLATAAAAALLLALYVLWFRDSSFVKVEQVEITGLTSNDADRLQAALTGTAKTMSTLNLDRERLERAAAGYPVVKAIEVEADFPHGLRIEVIEHDAAAMASGPGGDVPVAGDGTVLRDMPVDKSKLPTIEYEGGLEGDRLADAKAVQAATVAGAAPKPLRARVEDITHTSDRGIVVQLEEGPELVFGNSTRPRAKWIAAAAVLADETSQGAAYLDLRIPERPAAGGLAVPQPEVETSVVPQP
jgi:cell division protein FtsQ